MFLRGHRSSKCNFDINGKMCYSNSRNTYLHVRLFLCSFRKRFSGFLLSAIGAGVVKSNLAVFGAEQIQQSKISAHYFDKYALVVNIGSMIAILILPYIQYKIIEDYYFIPHLVATLMLLLATVLFILGYRCRYYYIHKTSNKTVINKCIPITINALQSWYRNKQKPTGDEDIRNSPQFLEQQDSNGSSVIIPHLTKKQRVPSSFLNFAIKSYGGQYEEEDVMDVKTLRKAVIVFSLLVPY